MSQNQTEMNDKRLVVLFAVSGAIALSFLALVAGGIGYMMWGPIVATGTPGGHVEVQLLREGEYTIHVRTSGSSPRGLAVRGVDNDHRSLHLGKTQGAITHLLPGRYQIQPIGCDKPWRVTVQITGSSF